MSKPTIPLLRPRDTENIKSIEYNITPGNTPLVFELPPPIIYHYTSLDSAKKIVENHSLKFSAPDTFNDPFDMYAGLIDFSATEYQKRNWHKTSIHIAQQSKKEQKRLKLVINKAPTAKFSAARKLSFNKMKQFAGVSCFSKFNNIQLMWSHYGNKHNGICLGFDFHPVTYYHEYSLFLRNVNYPDVITPINLHTHTDAAVEQWLTTKSKAWSYESEVRAFIYDRQGNDFFDFERVCLKEIYFGCRITQNDIEYMLQLLENNNYKVSTKMKMIIDDDTFDIKAVNL